MSIPVFFLFFFIFLTCSVEIIDIFPRLGKKKLLWLFLGHHESEIFKSLHDNNCASCLHSNFRFDDLDVKVTGVSEI